MSKSVKPQLQTGLPKKGLVIVKNKKIYLKKLVIDPGYYKAIF